MGYDKHLFIKTVSDEICCDICKKVLENPVQCNKCQTWFCQACLDSACQHPEDKCVHEYKEVNKHMKNRIDEMMIRCRYYQNGCIKIMKVVQSQKHHYVCDYASYICNTKECFGKGKKNVDYHVKHCPFGVIACNVCNKKMKRQDAQNHSCVSWLFTVIENLEIKNRVLEEEIFESRDSQNVDLKKNNLSINDYKQKIQQLDKEIGILINENKKLNQEYDDIKQQCNLELFNKINDFQQNAENKLSLIQNKNDEVLNVFTRRISDRITQLILNTEKNLDTFNEKVYEDSFDLVTVKQKEENGIRNGNGTSRNNSIKA